MAVDPNSVAGSGAGAFPNAPLPRAVAPQLFPSHRHYQQHPSLYSAQPLHSRAPIQPYAHAHDGASYPVASSGRGFVSHRGFVGDQTVTVAGVPPRSPGNFHVARPIQPHQAQHFLPHHIAAVKGIPVSVQPKVAPSSSIPDSNGYKDINIREKSRDDKLAVVRNRKVRITEGSSLFALCRSWLRNGSPEEIHPQYGDNVRSLPKPLPITVATGSIKEEREELEDNDDSREEDEGSVEDISPKDLFRRHVKRAKKVRARMEVKGTKCTIKKIQAELSPITDEEFAIIRITATSSAIKTDCALQIEARPFASSDRRTVQKRQRNLRIAPTVGISFVDVEFFDLVL